MWSPVNENTHRWSRDLLVSTFLHGPRMAVMPIESTLLQLNLEQKHHLAMMMVKSFSMIETNVQNMNLVTVPKLGGKNTSTCQSTLWSPGRGYYVGATLRYTCSSSWVHASRGGMAINVLSPRITTAFGYLCDVKLFGPEESHQRLGTVEAKLKIQDCQLPYNLIPLLPGRKQLKSNEVH